ncbi:hypothetical protein GCM10010324_06300 [Streptomyces hiroshimensis]|uniref:Carrier domain-containing protein n=2 Tax=Streptomyces TaxID=1883 RepID=A0ABQ2Y6D4_9ACTN|nr:hypothetical protein GCM10010324_06300 [Streptomyces hiroshimensis]
MPHTVPDGVPEKPGKAREVTGKSAATRTGAHAGTCAAARTAPDPTGKADRTMSPVYDKLVDLLVDRFAVDRAAIGPDVTFEELEMDSLFLVELLLVIESEFQVKIGEEAAAPTDTIATVVKVIANEIAATAP